MSYEIKPQNVKSFIEDRNIKLPRFQRKQTWNDKKNFLLAISVFKGYPLGVTILNIEGRNANTTRWLLDGRQRRNALTLMSEDPERIYFWARSFIGFKNNDQPEVLSELFWEKVNEYIEVDDSVDEENGDIEVLLESDSEGEIRDFERSTSLSGLNSLLNIIEICHNNNWKGTRLTRPFDFSEFFTNQLPYVVTVDATRKLSSKRLKVFINEYFGYCKVETLATSLVDSFISFYETRNIPKNDASKYSFREKVKQSWKILYERIEMFDNIDKTLQTSDIGLIEVSDITITDSQKIFNIINTGGSPLSAAEILSAKPSWNVVVDNPSSEVIEKKEALYKLIGTEVTDVVRWDLGATLIARIKDEGLLFTSFNSDTLEKRISLGFKLLAGYTQNGVKKEDINNLCNNENITNTVKLEHFIINLNQMIKVINSCSFFSFVRSWNKSIMDLLSDAILLNFIILLYKDYEKRNFPIANTEAKKFQKNAFILFDKMVYEYSKRAWRGSSDSIIAKNIAAFDRSIDLFEAVTEEKWVNLLNDIFDKAEIEGVSIDQRAVTPILYHYYYLSSIHGPNGFEIEVDHIFPKSLFESSALTNKEQIVNNLYNLELLPKGENISKSNKRLIEISDSWLKTQIYLFSGIEENEYSLFSNLGNYEQLKELRKPIFKDAFTEKRNKILNN